MTTASQGIRTIPDDRKTRVIQDPGAPPATQNVPANSSGIPTPRSLADRVAYLEKLAKDHGWIP